VWVNEAKLLEEQADDRPKPKTAKEIAAEKEQARQDLQEQFMHEIDDKFPLLLRGFLASRSTGLFSRSKTEYWVADGPLIYSATNDSEFLSIYPSKRDSGFPNKRIGYVSFGEFRKNAKISHTHRQFQCFMINPDKSTTRIKVTKYPEDVHVVLTDVQGISEFNLRRFDAEHPEGGGAHPEEGGYSKLPKIRGTIVPGAGAATLTFGGTNKFRESPV
jgi:hypothetical protein